MRILSFLCISLVLGFIVRIDNLWMSFEDHLKLPLSPRLGFPIVIAQEPLGAGSLDIEGGLGGPNGDEKNLLYGNDSQFSTTEIEVLQRLSERREILEKREKELELRESLIGSAEKRIDEKLVQLNNLEKKIIALISDYDDKQKERILKLVKIYSEMPPERAAVFFEKLNMDILLSLIQTMKETKVAPILANMNPDIVKKMTELLTERIDILK